MVIGLHESKTNKKKFNVMYNRESMKEVMGCVEKHHQSRGEQVPGIRDKCMPENTSAL